jgi:protocatechuate 3,4-dioxygenase beta subunit
MRTILCGILAAAVAFVHAPSAQQQAGAGSGRAPAFTGRVVTAGSGTEKRPVRRARVTLTGAGLTAPRVADTDTKGEYRFNGVGPGGYTVTVQKPGFVKLEGTASPGATLTMERGGALEGIVTDAGGDPVWNVVVSALQPQEKGAPKTIGQTRTDDLGRYRLHSLAAGDYIVEAATDRTFLVNQFVMQGERRAEVSRAFYPASATAQDAKVVRVSAGRDSSAIDITFNPPPPAKDPAAPPAPPRPDATGTARIAGTVVDATSGRPINAAQLLLVPVDGQRLTNWKRTDAKGRFEYTQLEARRYTLRFQADRFVTLEFGQKRPGEAGLLIQLKDGEDYRADMRLPRASALEGTLLDEFGDPAPSVIVQASQRAYAAGRHRLMPVGSRIASVPSDDRGRYRISALSPGEYYVSAMSGVYTEANEVGGFAPTYFPGTTDAAAATPVTVAFGADSLGTTFALTPA